MITRFDRPTATQHTGQFLKLNYEQLKEPILKQDEEYKATLDAWDTYSQALAAQDYLPQDMEVAEQKRQELYEREADLRRTVNNDLLDPTYQSGMRSLLLSEASDRFYRDSAYNYKMYQEVYLPEYQKYVATHGVAPRDWQNPYGVSMRDYQGALAQGKLEYKPIEGRIPFQEKAIEVLKPILAKKLNDKTLKVREEDGRKFLYTEDGARITTADIKEMMRGSDLVRGRAMDQLKLDFQASPQLMQEYGGDFERYFNEGVLNSIGAVLEYEWSEENFASWFPKEDDEYGRRGYSRIKPKYTKEQERRIDLGPAVEEIYGASSPTSLPDYETTKQAYTYYSGQARDYLNGTTIRENGKTKHIPPLGDRMLHEFGISAANDQGIKIDVAPFADTNVLSASLSYVDDNGKEQRVDLMSKDIFVKRKELPAQIRDNLDTVLPRINDMASEYTELASSVQQIEEFTDVVGRNVFGDAQWQDLTKNGQSAFIQALDETSRQGVLNSNTSKLAFALENGAPTDPLPPELRPQAKGRVTTGMASPFTYAGQYAEEAKYNARIEDDIYLMSEMLGIDPAEWKVNDGESVYKEDIDSFYNKVNQLKMSGDLIVPKGFTQQVAESQAMRVLEEKGDHRVKEFKQAFEDNWLYGVDYSLKRVGKEPVKAGTKLRPRTIYHFNQLGTSGSGSGELFKKNVDEILGNIISFKLTGDADQRTQFSAIEIFQFGTNEEATDTQYQALAKEDDEGNLIGHEIVGFTVDDEGYNVVLKAKDVGGNLGKKQSNVFEIRDKNLVQDLMIKSGMGDKLAIEVLRNALAGFQIEEKDEAFAGSVLTHGQKRSKAASTIGDDVFQRPVERLMYPTRDPKTGITYEEGTYKYYSLRDMETKYSTTMLDIVDYYFNDRAYALNESLPLESITSKEFDGQILGIDSLQNLGKNMVHPTMVDILKDLSQTTPKPLTITSVLRPESEGSMHKLGRAVDFSVKDESGNLDKDRIDFFFEKYKELRNIGVKVLFEFPSITEQFKQFQEEYNTEFVYHNPEARGIHIHIHYDEQAAKNAAAQLTGEVQE